MAWVASSLSTGSGTAESRAITTDEAGNSYVVGRFIGTVDFFGTMLTSTSASVPSGFLAKFARTGVPVFVKKIGSNALTELLAVVVKPTGEIYVAGSVAGTFASGAVNFVVAGTDAQNALLLRLDANSDAVWARIATASAGAPAGQQAAATPDSDFIFAGYSGVADFGSGLIPAGTSNKEAFVAYYHGFSDFELGDPKTQAQWRENHFTVAELADAGFSADDRDPDGDGLHNFLEYALGQSPKQRDAPPGLLVLEAPGDLLYTYNRNPRATELTY
jgi:hypothetical protein